MKITVLGSGGFNYPLSFCACDNCKKARILKGKNIRKRASILIDDKVLVDFTPDTNNAMNMYGKDMSDVEILLQTHTHNDHFDVNLFGTFARLYHLQPKYTLNLVASKLALENVQERVSKYEKIDLFNVEFQKLAKLKPVQLDHGENVKILDYEIKAIKTTHHENIGAELFLIKKDGKTVFYATDTPPFTEETYDELVGEQIDVVFIDQNFGLMDYTYSHLNISAVGEIVARLKRDGILKIDAKIFATHISHEGNPCHDELEQITAQKGWNIAFDGQEIEV